MLNRTVFATVAAAVFAFGVAPANAAYPEKNITLIIPFSTGGGFDTYARLIAPYVEKYLPRKVKVIPKNMPGAGGRMGLAAGYRAKPDGYTLTLANIPGVAIPPILASTTSRLLASCGNRWAATSAVSPRASAAAGPFKAWANSSRTTIPLKRETEAHRS